MIAVRKIRRGMINRTINKRTVQPRGGASYWPCAANRVGQCTAAPSNLLEMDRCKRRKTNSPIARNKRCKTAAIALCHMGIDPDELMRSEPRKQLSREVIGPGADFQLQK